MQAHGHGFVLAESYPNLPISQAAWDLCVRLHIVCIYDGIRPGNITAHYGSFLSSLGHNQIPPLPLLTVGLAPFHLIKESISALESAGKRYEISTV